ncbi:MAG: TetR/AcrR family transcriptional regulator [Psychroflexus sp.]|jgi:AcrR family transcriptional regulator|nr:TetR/AcrR family transcriptional regulator [Psychroflexus sp.]MDR9448877.1 TetR/AcrR family transcriptional regulator [Psychroflexus sp.]
METISVFKVSLVKFAPMKEEMVKNAAKLFLSYGFKSLTMSDIAKEMGVSKKTIYAHFDSKDDLVKASTDHVHQYIDGGIDDIVEQDLNPIEEMFTIKSFVMDVLMGNRGAPEYQLQKYYPEIYHSMRERQFNKIKSCVVNNINKGIEQGIYRDNLNVSFIARIYYIGITGISNQDVFSPDEFSSNYLYEDFLDYHFHGITTPKGRRKLKKIRKKFTEQ